MNRWKSHPGLDGLLALAGPPAMSARHAQLATPPRGVTVGTSEAGEVRPDAGLCGGLVDAEACAGCARYPCRAVESLLTGRQGMLAWLVLCLGD